MDNTEHLNYDAAIAALAHAEALADNGNARATLFLRTLARHDRELYAAQCMIDEMQEKRAKIGEQQDALLAEMIREYTTEPATIKIGA